MQENKVSIIIRGKNEEDWLGLCLTSIHQQSYKNHEVIYVDNESSDASIQIAKDHKVNAIRKIKKFLPGNAINIGIRASKGKYIVILSAHCIPHSKEWLARLVKSIQKPKIGGVYGRQLPLSSTSSDDARDLLITFGNEDRVQYKDPFFHNANSIIKRTLWEKINFDNRITNIEDRDWAKKIIDLGYSIKYDSQASVYHFHGLHQHNNYQSFRASAVNNLIQKINQDESSLPPWLETSKRLCPIVFFGDTEDIKNDIHRYKDCNKSMISTSLFYYGAVNPLIEGITFIKRRVSKNVALDKFTKDILLLINQSIGFKAEAISFVDLSYKNFIKDSYLINKEKIFQDNVHFSAFAYLEKGDIWASQDKKITPIKKMFDSNTQFLRVTFGQSSIIRCSTIRLNQSNAADGFANIFKDMRFLIRK